MKLDWRRAPAAPFAVDTVCEIGAVDHDHTTRLRLRCGVRQLGSIGVQRGEIDTDARDGEFCQSFQPALRRNVRAHRAPVQMRSRFQYTFDPASRQIAGPTATNRRAPAAYMASTFVRRRWTRCRCRRDLAVAAAHLQLRLCDCTSQSVERRRESRGRIVCDEFAAAVTVTIGWRHCDAIE